jgi:hypothetical protein
MVSIIDEPDPFVFQFYHEIITFPNKFVFADIFSLVYLSLRNIYDLPYLDNVLYRNKKPSTISIFGENLSILSSLTLIIETINAILNIDKALYENNEDILLDIIISLNNMVINPFKKDNFELIKTKMMEEFLQLMSRIR